MAKQKLVVFPPDEQVKKSNETIRVDGVCRRPGCDKPTGTNQWGCVVHWYRLPMKIRQSIKITFNEKENCYYLSDSEAQSFLSGQDTEVPTVGYVPGDGEPEVILSEPEAKALLAMGAGADVHNYAVSCDLRRMQCRIPRCHLYFTLPTAKNFSNDPRAENPYFGCVVTPFGQSIALKFCKEKNPKIEGIVQWAQKNTRP